ncbi:hypothetical protein EC973_002962 [Apophysomyces ossiformis]|uniref:Uncharacterized protein n=1 Tax=Apophysomyces ossiformis TaxID=679940 RepID=A0A8H7EMK1_9FUNG|nr:hypothetical protein EC973_002962 [Apophysomyces ossiformis]
MVLNDGICHFLQQHVHKSYVLTDSYLKQYSEQPLIVKYCGAVFKYCSDYDDKMFLQL